MPHSIPKPSLLLVDDDPVILEIICEFLKRFLADVYVDATDSPGTALQRALSNQYSAVVTDVMMPGISGLELASKIHAMNPGTPIVFMSGMEQGLEQCRPHAFACLRKPFDIGTFVETVRSAVAKGPFHPRPLA
ncbi:MAG TPA: response regulator [Nitrospiraceae bacterium]|nr:response regulator [Nitrospiraceae bacterium]